MRRIGLLGVGLFALALGACGDEGDTRVFRGSGADLVAAVDAFRAALGEPVNGGTPGEQPAGRRQIDWDAVPAANTNTDDFPGDFFNGPASPRARGVVFSNGSGRFRVSDNDFTDVNASYGGEFRFFSPPRTFAPIDDVVVQVDFFVAGTPTPARVRGFGAIFSDVDLPGSAAIEYFAGTRSLGVLTVPVRTAGEPSTFLGVVFEDRRVTRVRLLVGQAPIGAGTNDLTSGGAADVVVLDDFLYDEPRPR